MKPHQRTDATNRDPAYLARSRADVLRRELIRLLSLLATPRPTPRTVNDAVSQVLELADRLAAAGPIEEG